MCEEIQINAQYLLSGEYKIADSIGDPQQVYGKINTICGVCGWTRLAKLDMTEPGGECSDTLKLYDESNGVRTCDRKKQLMELVTQ